MKTNLRNLLTKNNLNLQINHQFSSNANKEPSSPYAYSSKEHIQPEHVIKQKVQLLAQLITKSKHPIFFTGAGISTSLGIPDYRSGQDTVLKTGPGLWNRSQQQIKSVQQKKHSFIDQLIPSTTHMAIYTLIQQGIFKHVVSQNTDGLHLRSGIKKINLSQLHGNRNLQYCIQCKRKYLRDFRTLKRQEKYFKPGEKRDHATGRLCENCNGQLHDSIIYFGEKLPREQLVRSYEQGARSDLCLAIGSSLTVRPSSNVPLLPMKYQQQGKLAIINIQQTLLDKQSSLKINGFCDQVMIQLMQKLGVRVEVYKTVRFLQVLVEKEYSGWGIRVSGVDQQHQHYSFVKSVLIVKRGEERQRMGKQEKQQEQDLRRVQQSIIQLKSKFQFRIQHQDHQTLKQINLRISFFNTLHKLHINLYDLFQTDDIIGHHSIILKIVSINNQEWKIHNKINQ